MKKTLIITAIFGLVLSACSHSDHPGTASSNGELKFSPTVEERETVTKAGSSFFESGYSIDVSIYTQKTGTTANKYIYSYTTEGIFEGKPGFRFSLDDTYIDSLTAIWPEEAIRNEGIKTDQSTLENYRKADWLTARASVNGVMPTDTPVPLNFTRDNTMLEFELVGQNNEGLDIETLIIELQDEDTGQTAYRAYCGSENGHASLILEAGTQLEAEGDIIIGMLTVTNGDNYYIILSDMDLTLEAGKRYLVTLTSQGYDIDAFVYITGWSQVDNGIGIPFTQPDENGYFHIETGTQLITMSYLIRHYIPDDNFDWPTRTYVISENIEVTENNADLYVRIPRENFSRQILMNGQSVDSIAYGNGQFLYLYANE